MQQLGLLKTNTKKSSDLFHIYRSKYPDSRLKHLEKEKDYCGIDDEEYFMLKDVAFHIDDNNRGKYTLKSHTEILQMKTATDQYIADKLDQLKEKKESTFENEDFSIADIMPQVKTHGLSYHTPQKGRELNLKEKDVKETPAKRHYIVLSPRSYYSHAIPQKYDPKLITVHRYKNPNNSLDETMVTYFDSVNGMMFRRGKKKLTMFIFANPSLHITTKKEDFNINTDYKNFERKTAHTCTNTFSHTLKYQKSEKNQSNWNRRIILCYAPELEIGSHFVNTENKQSNTTIYSYPTGYVLKQDIHKYQLGSFIKLVSLKQNDKNKKEIQSQEVSLNYMNFKKYSIKLDPNQLESMYAFKVQSKDGEPLLSMIVSMKGENQLFQGSYHGSKNLGELSQTKFKDFRTIVGVSSMESGVAFVQIEDLSYSVDMVTYAKDTKVDKNKKAIIPWKGTNGVCRQFVKIKYQRIGATVICYHDKKFYIKYVKENGLTETKLISLSQPLELVISHSSFKFLWIRTSDYLSHHFIIFYTLEESNHDLRLMFVELYGDLHPIILLINNIKMDTKLLKLNTGENIGGVTQVEDFSHFSINEILELKVGGNYLIISVAHNQKSKYTQNDHFFRTYLIKPDYNVKLIKHSSLPSGKLTFQKNPRMIVSQVEHKIDSEAVSKLDRGDIRYYIGSKVYLKKIIKEKYTGSVKTIFEPRLLIMRPDQPSLGSMNLLQLDDEHEFLDFGAFYDEKFSSKEVHFAVLTREAKTAEEKQKEQKDSDLDSKKKVSSEENLAVFLIKSSDSQIKFSMGLKSDKVIFVDDFSKKKATTTFLGGTKESNQFEESFTPIKTKQQAKRQLQETHCNLAKFHRDFRAQNHLLEEKEKNSRLSKTVKYQFGITSQIYTSEETTEINQKNLKAESTTIMLQNQDKIDLDITYINWFEKFRSYKKYNKIRGDVDKVNFSFSGLMAKHLEKIEIQLSNKQSFYQGLNNEKFIKINPQKYINGDVVDTFGYVDSFLEKNLGLVIIPNMTEIETDYSPRFSKAAEKYYSMISKIKDEEKEKNRQALVEKNPWIGTRSGLGQSCFTITANHNISIFWKCYTKNLDHPNRYQYGCSGQSNLNEESNDELADTLNQLDRHRKYSRVFFGENNFFYEFYRGRENIKLDEWESHLGDGSGCYSTDPYIFWKQKLSYSQKLGQKYPNMKTLPMNDHVRSSPYYFEDKVFYIEEEGNSGRAKVIISFDLTKSARSNGFTTYKESVHLRSGLFDVDGNIQFFRIKVFRFESSRYKTKMHDYLLIMYEYNRQTELYLKARALRVKIMKDDNTMSIEEDISKIDSFNPPKNIEVKVRCSILLNIIKMHSNFIYRPVKH